MTARDAELQKELSEIRTKYKAPDHASYYETRGSKFDELETLHLRAGMAAPGWAWFYTYGKDPTEQALQERYGAGVKAYKQALVDNGYATGIVIDLPRWGNFARDRTIELQRAATIGVDGTVGPVTAKNLIKKYVAGWERRYAIPESLIGKQGTLESNNHAVAQGFLDPNDEGWGQIHLPFYPDVTKEEAWDLTFAVKFMAGQLWSRKLSLGDWDAALAAYNVGFSTAKLWLAAGKPASGGAIWHTPTGDVDSFSRAFQYVKLVRSQSY